MSEPQQPPVPPNLPATPQPAAGQPGAGQHAVPPNLPATPQAYAGQGRGTHPGYPAPHYGDAGTSAKPVSEGKGFAFTALLIAAVTFAVNLLVSLLAPLLYQSANGFDTFNALTGILGVLSLLAYAAALVLGLLAVKRAGSPLLAGIAIGIAGVGLLGLAVNFVASFFYRFI